MFGDQHPPVQNDQTRCPVAAAVPNPWRTKWQVKSPWPAKMHENLMGFNAISWGLIAFIIACHGFEWNAGHFEYENPRVLGVGVNDLEPYSSFKAWSSRPHIYEHQSESISKLALRCSPPGTIWHTEPATKCQLPCSVYCRQESPCHWYTRWEALWLINTCAVSASLKYQKWYRGFLK